MAEPGVIVAIVGAESTGKTTLANELALALRGQGLSVVVVPEALRVFCEKRQRTPTPHEQTLIAQTQSQCIAQAVSTHDVVLADTTALMTAVYSDYLFDDASLYEQALSDHALVQLTLLTALDLPWVADGLQRDGSHVREPVDSLIRQALHRSGLGYAVVSGQGAARLEHALLTVQHALSARQRALENASRPRWRWLCDKCDDGECEQHWLPRSS